jgi:hypothetical protein
MLLRATTVLGVGLALALVAAVHGADTRKADAAKEEDCGCNNHGTSVRFFDSPQAAAVQAKKAEKLVMVLHISGNFENPDFT